MASLRLAIAIVAPSADEFVVVRYPPPPPLPEEEYRLVSDSDLWDLPSAHLNLTDDSAHLLKSNVTIQGAETIKETLDLSKFDFGFALDQVLQQVGLSIDSSDLKLVLLKFVEEAEFGPGPPIKTLFLALPLDFKVESFKDTCKWITKESASESLCGVKPCADRVGPLAYIGYLSQSTALPNKISNSRLLYQEYPPGVTLVPMKSGTLKPFSTTNLVIILPKKPFSGLSNSGSSIHADGLIMDPGCKLNAELADLISFLPRNLLVFVTHHHPDHVNGLSIVQKINADATLLAHENTISHIHGNWSGASAKISGGEEIYIGDQELKVIFAPGHTDGHLALLHVDTNSLVVGDHCVGEGSAILDAASGGNMKDYFDTTYKFIDLSPHVLIPMHGRINLWPKRMLCGYLKHRRDREARILKSIENGACTLIDIISDVYGDVDKKLWFLASYNVKLHVDYLNYQNKLPKKFSSEKFKSSCGVAFKFRWLCTYFKAQLNTAVVVAITIGGAAAVAYALKKR